MPEKGNSMQVREAIGEYIASKRQAKPKTKKENTYMLGLFCSWCESRGIQLETVKAKVVGEYVDHLSEHLAPRKKGNSLSSHTLYRHIASVRAFLRWCSLDEDFEEFVKLSTVQKIARPKKEVKVIGVFNEQHVKAMLKACEGQESEHLIQRDKAIISLLFDTGIRAAELIGLRMDKIDLSPGDPHIMVRGKGDKEREIGMGDRSRKELWRYVHRYREADRGTRNPVFLSRSHRQMNIRTLQIMIERTGVKAGIEGVRCSPHSFRHSYAVSFIRHGGDIFRLSELLGHTSINITQLYLRSFNQGEARRGAINPLDEVL